MVTAEGLEARSASLADMLEKKLKLRGRGLDAKLRRAGRRLPRSVRLEAEKFVEARRLMGHPKLMMQLDPAGLDAAYAKCARWLDRVDLKAARRDRLIGMAAGISFQLLLIAAAFLTWMVWSGHL